jgi:alpha-tubulin suppressor-like RCC1 family protein
MLKTDGTVWGAGINNKGQLGTLSQSWTQIAIGDSHSLAISSNGTLWTWGDGLYSQLGEYSIGGTYRSQPGLVTSGSWKSVSAGVRYSAAIKSDDTLWLWGSNFYYQLGVSGLDQSNYNNPQQVSGGGTWKTVSAGEFGTLAIKSDHTLWAWGYNGRFSQLGASFPDDYYLDPIRPANTTGSWNTVSAGSSHTLAIKSDGTLYAWGDNTYGQIGNQSPAALSWSQIVLGNAHAVALRSDGALYAWGANTNGQLGDSTTVSRSSPVRIGSGFWTFVAAGASHSAAIDTTGSLYLWGLNTGGRIGDGTVVSRSAPVQVSGGGVWTRVACGLTHTTAIKSGGLLFSWGANTSGVLGLGTSTAAASSRSTPQQIGASTWSFVSSINLHVAAITTTGLLFVWGDGADGKIGDGFAVNRSSPVQIGTGISWKSASAGINHTSAIRTADTLWLWGLGTTGQLGDNTRVTKSSPVQVAGTGTWVATASGNSYTVAIKTDGSLFSWGATSHILGDGTTVNRSSPVQLGTLAGTWTSVSANLSTAVLANSNRSIWGWGANASGQLGIGDTTTRSSPSQIGLLFPTVTSALQISSATTWTAVSAGQYHSLALKSDGTLWAWGLGVNGQLGQGNIISYGSPIQVVGTWTAIAVGLNHSLAIKNDLKVYGWGRGDLYALGGSSNIYTPTILYNSTNSNSIAAGGNNSAYLIPGNDNLYTTGLNTQGQNGWFNTFVPTGTGFSPVTNITAFSLSPKQILPTQSGFYSSTTATAISAGGLHSLAVTYNTDPTQVYAISWGDNTYGQLGRGSVGSLGFGQEATPYWMQNPSSGLLTYVVAVSAGGQHSLVLDSFGNLSSTGNNNFGQLGTTFYFTATGYCRTMLSPVVACSAGFYHSLAITSNRTVWAWGDNTYRQVDFTGAHRSSPVQVSATLSANFIAAGNISTFIIQTATNILYIAGYNLYGQLGIGTNDTFSALASSRQTTAASPVQLGTNSWSAVSSGYLYNTAIRSDGSLWAWGTNSTGQLGDITTVTRSSPVQIGTDVSWKTVSAGYDHTLAITSQGTLYAWGDNSSGKLGTVDLVTRSSPVAIGAGTWNSVSAGRSHSLAINSQRQMFGWGSYAGGTLTQNYSWTQSASGLSHAAAIKADNTLWLWGKNTYGQLGDLTTNSRSSPVQVSGGGLWQQVATGAFSTFGIKTDGTLWAWGRNTQGELGTNSTISASSPVQVAGGGSWSTVAGSSNSISFFTYGIKTDGTLWAWGDNSYGQLGKGDTIARSSPVQVGTATSWSKLQVGSFGPCVIDTAGRLWVCGYNNDGALAQNDIAGRSTLVQVTSGAVSWTTVSASFGVLAIDVAGNLWGWGANTSGSLGIGDELRRSTPVQVTAVASTWTDVAFIGHPSKGYGQGAIGIAGNQMYGWGYAGFANTLNYNLTPVTNGLSGLSWKPLPSMNSVATLITQRGQLWTWGFNGQGNLGIGTRDFYAGYYGYDEQRRASLPMDTASAYSLVARSSPVQVGSSNQWQSAFAGNNFNLAINNNALYGWGLNNTNASITGSLSNPAFLGLPDTYIADPQLLATTATSASAKNLTYILKN